MIRTLFGRGWVFGVMLALACFVLLNVSLSNVTGLRVDLTQDRLFTLSQGTRNVISSLDQPVKIDLYFSQALLKQVAIYGTYANRVRDVVREFGAAGGGKIAINEHNPEPFSETEDAAVKAGLQGVPLDAGGEKVYFGLSARSGDQTYVIPFFQPEREAFLEYDLTKLLHSAANPKKPVIGVMTALRMFGDFVPRPGQNTQWPIVDILEETFEVRNLIDVPKELTKDIDVLFLAHPAHLTDDEMYAIDQYLMRGGKALIVTDPHNEMAAASMAAGRPMAITSNVNKLLESWGVQVLEGMVAGDREVARVVNAGRDGEVRAAPYLLWLALQQGNISQTDTVTQGVTSLNFASSGVIEAKENAAVTVEPLVQTSEQSQAFATDMIGVMQPNILDFLDKFQPGGKRLTLAARINGRVKSIFPDGPPKKPEPEKAEKEKDAAAKDAAANAGKTDTEPKAAEKAETETKKDEGPKWLPHETESTAPLNVILIADTDMLHDRFWIRVQEFFGQRVSVPFANNGDFIANALENLSGSDDLISLRSRGTAQRPFTLVNAIRVDAEQRYRKTEQDLATRLAEAEKSIEAAQSKAREGGDAVKPGDDKEKLEQEITRLRDDFLSIRKQLRDVQLNLRKDIESLHAWLQFVNIGLVPIVVGIAALILGVVRSRRRAAAQT